MQTNYLRDRTVDRAYLNLDGIAKTPEIGQRVDSAILDEVHSLDEVDRGRCVELYFSCEIDEDELQDFTAKRSSRSTCVRHRYSQTNCCQGRRSTDQVRHPEQCQGGGSNAHH